MKPHFGFLSFCLLLAVSLLSSPLHADFTIDVHINSAENPTLTFGEADVRTRAPHPPFSGMFGVVDVCFANPEENPPAWYDRLAEDVKTANTANQWILVAKSNARLQFKSEAMPSYLKIVYNDVKTGDKKITALVNDLSFSVKTGGVYTITRDDTVDPAENPNAGTNQFIAKGDSGTITITPPDFAAKTMNISFAAGMGVLAYDGENLVPRGITLANVDWIITVNKAVQYEWDASYTKLTVTLSGTRAEGDPIVTMTPNRSSAPPIQSTITTLGDDPETQQITNIIDWILQKAGTLNVNHDDDFTTADVLLIDAFQKAFASAYIDTEDIDLALQQLSLDQVKDFLRGVNKDFATAEAFEELLNSWEEFAGIDGVDEFSTADVLVIDAIQKAYASLFIEYENASMAVGNLNLTEIKDKLRGLNKNFATENSVEQGKSLIDF